MDKEVKVCKYSIMSSFRAISIYYGIIILIIILSIIGSMASNVHVQVSGMDFSTTIFLFILGLNFFKENFYFAQANNISRKVYFKGTLLSMFPIALAMSFIDIILNRILNIFLPSPTNYDMVFGTFIGESISETISWLQSNNIEVLFKTFIFQFVIYIVVIAVGLLIRMIYYRCNKLMKTVVSLIPIALMMIMGIIAKNFSDLITKVSEVIIKILGLNTGNVYLFSFTLICLFAILMSFVYLSLRKAVVKEV